jgi:hypothetical protein
MSESNVSVLIDTYNHEKDELESDSLESLVRQLPD